ncbi:hypothetical protein IE53DRAFT_363118 [Violaceomyces palustris]|uniref:Uncharacterized protein n=1 Tax=Violaceomyces palustris TaxID=1673888 RepID=A0ACD0NUJ1_9BASI|nr:hypothetical protein IE53DRAFT_363118 [Violaceomyces palustris]
MEKPLPDDSSQKVLTVLSQRVPLKLNGLQGNTDTRTLQEELVARHMRRLGRVAINGEMAQTFAPSEPVLSAAASYLLRLDPLERWANCIDELHRTVSKTFVTFGEDGEEVVRILLSMAVDIFHAQNLLPKDFRPDVGNYSETKIILEDLERTLERATILDPAPVWSWLDTLVGFSSWPRVGAETELATGKKGSSSKIVRRGPGPAAEKWMQEHFINFTHFASLDRLYPASSSIPMPLLTDGWLRQCAFLGLGNQEDWDILIPVHRIPPRQPDCEGRDMQDTLFDPDALSYIFVQIKNRHGYSMRQPLGQVKRPAPSDKVRGKRQLLERGKNLGEGTVSIGDLGHWPTSTQDPSMGESSEAHTPVDWDLSVPNVKYAAPGISEGEGSSDPVRHIDHLWMFFNLRGKSEVHWDSQTITSPSGTVASSHQRHAVILGGFTVTTYSLLDRVSNRTTESLKRLLGVIANEDETEGRIKETDPATWNALQGRSYCHTY